ncbi:MAG: response regulator [Gammaproteobacteria bacterium]|nr:response regulator [Gammaproteobacteria bacterium]
MRLFSKKSAEKSGSSNESLRGNGTVLVVDDSPTELHILKGFLEEAGYAVLLAENAELGIEQVQSAKPDLILMDVVMPGLNGFQATRQLSRNPETSDIPVIMVTTKDQETDRTWGLRQGAKEYIIKPVEKNELLSRIKAVLSA